MDDCQWLPEKYQYPDWNNFKEYEDELYQYFLKEIFFQLYWDSQQLHMRSAPKVDGKHESFYHITCKDYSNKSERDPDPERSIRIPWIKPILENTPCYENCCNDKPLLWRKKHNNGKDRIKIYFKRYFIVIEERPDYLLFITAYYVDGKKTHESILKEYEKNRGI